MPKLFPDIYPTVWEPDESDTYQSRIQAKNGFTQINTHDVVAPWKALGAWQTLTRVNLDLIWDHWHAYRRDVFSLFDFWSMKIRDVYVGVGNGSRTQWSLPARQLVGAVVKVNGSAATPTIVEGAGADGQAVATFAAPVANGGVITLSATQGRRLYDALYVSATFPPRHREADIFTCELSFEEAIS